jgi:hypothetical protein
LKNEPNAFERLSCGTASFRTVAGLSPGQRFGDQFDKTNKRRSPMTNIFTYAAIVLGLSATATVAFSNRNMQLSPTAEAHYATDGAFRDGLYLGKLAAESGHVQLPAIGRWSTEQDRAMFIVGYERGYDQILPGETGNHAQSQ